MRKPANGASTAVFWIACAAWVGVGIVSPWTHVADGHSTAVRIVLGSIGWLFWLGTLLGLLVPSATSLTVVRTVAPVALVAAVVDGRPVSVAVTLAAFLLLFSTHTGDTLVQGSAYGAETRFLLRTPLPYLMPAVLVTAALDASVIAGPVLLAARNWALGIPVTVMAGVLVWRAPVRLHRLSRRWLVIVPAGFVVHDHMVLAETIMLRRDNIAMLAPRPSNEDAADLTGGVLGRRILVRLHVADKVAITPITMRLLGTGEALHVQSFTVSPRRTGAALDALVNSRG